MELGLTKNKFKVLILGVGGTGSNLAPLTAQLFSQAESSIVLIDGDMIEEKNLKNQRFTQKNVGRYKAEVLAEQYKHIWPKLNISFIPRYFESKDTPELLKIVSDPNFIPIIVGCVDNNVTRTLMYNIFNTKGIENIVYIDSGNGTDKRIGQVITGVKIKGKKLLPCAADLNPAMLDDKDSIVSVNSCSQLVAEKPQNISTNVMAATILFCILNNIVNFDYVENNMTFFNAEKINVQGRTLEIA